MNLRDAMENYVVWRQAHGAKFNTARNLLRQFLRHADAEADADQLTDGTRWPGPKTAGKPAPWRAAG